MLRVQHYSLWTAESLQNRGAGCFNGCHAPLPDLQGRMSFSLPSGVPWLQVPPRLEVCRGRMCVWLGLLWRGRSAGAIGKTFRWHRTSAPCKEVLNWSSPGSKMGKPREEKQRRERRHDAPEASVLPIVYRASALHDARLSGENPVSFRCYNWIIMSTFGGQNLNETSRLVRPVYHLAVVGKAAVLVTALLWIGSVCVGIAADYSRHRFFYGEGAVRIQWNYYATEQPTWWSWTWWSSKVIWLPELRELTSSSAAHHAVFITFPIWLLVAASALAIVPYYIRKFLRLRRSRSVQ